MLEANRRRESKIVQAAGCVLHVSSRSPSLTDLSSATDPARPSSCACLLILVIPCWRPRTNTNPCVPRRSSAFRKTVRSTPRFAASRLGIAGLVGASSTDNGRSISGWFLVVSRPRDSASETICRCAWLSNAARRPAQPHLNVCVSGAVPELPQPGEGPFLAPPRAREFAPAGGCYFCAIPTVIAAVHQSRAARCWHHTRAYQLIDSVTFVRGICTKVQTHDGRHTALAHAGYCVDAPRTQQHTAPHAARAVRRTRADRR